MSRTLVFSSSVYSLETVKKAAYRFSGLLAVDIILEPSEIKCVLNFVPGSKEEEHAESIAIDFRNEVLDQDLRSIIAKETEATRNAILAFAFSKTGLQDGE